MNLCINETRFTDWLRGKFGFRTNQFWFDVLSDRTLNAGDESDSIARPKASFILGPWLGTELYLNFGLAFHSNDGRGSLTTIDPASGKVRRSLIRAFEHLVLRLVCEYLR